jgi:hypothetical protein
MSKQLEIALGIVTSIGGFLDVGAIACKHYRSDIHKSGRFQNK